MKKFCYEHLLILLIIIGFSAVLTVDWHRHNIEAGNKTVEMVMDYESIGELAKTMGVSEKELLRQFKQVGITTLAVYETTLEKLADSGKLTVFPGTKILDAYRAGLLQEQGWLQFIAKGDIKAEDVYIIGSNQMVLSEVKSDLERRLGAERVNILTQQGNKTILAIKANYEKVMKWNLGLPTDEMREVNNNGFFVMARPTNYNKVKPEDVRAAFERLNGINTSGVMFVAEEILGYPGNITETAAEMKKRGVTFAMIEHPSQLQFYNQAGMFELASLLDYQVARVYRIAKDEQPKLKVEEAVHRWAITTDQERNIRINLLHKYDKPEAGEDLIETNIRYITSVKNELIAKGYQLGMASTFPPYYPATWLLLTAVTGTLAAGILLVGRLVPISARGSVLLLLLGSIISLFTLYKGSGVLTRQAAALIAANTFPVLSMLWVLERWEKLQKTAALPAVIGEAVWGITAATAISLAGGLYVGALLGDVRFFLDIAIFRGVKLTFIAPIILIVLLLLKRYSQAKENNGKACLGEGLLKLLNYSLKFKSLLVIVFAGIAVWIYIGRSGHTAGVPVPGIEIRLRYLLEEMMYARPREKEFLIGHPAFFLAVVAIYRQWPRVVLLSLIVLATIGQGSMVETFAHLRTPVFVSFIRGIDGWLVGSVIGMVAAASIYAIDYCLGMLGRRPA